MVMDGRLPWRPKALVLTWLLLLCVVPLASRIEHRLAPWWDGTPPVTSILALAVFLPAATIGFYHGAGASGSRPAIIVKRALASIGQGILAAPILVFQVLIEYVGGCF